MPGGKKKSKKKGGNFKKQATEESSEASTTNPTKQQKNVARDPTPRANLDDAIIVEDVVLLNGQGNNNEAADNKSPFEAFVSKFDVGGEQVNPKGVTQSYSNNRSKEQVVKFERDVSDFVNKNFVNKNDAMKNRNMPETKVEKKQLNSAANPGWKTIEDFVNLGVPREIVMTKHPLANVWVFWWFRNDKSRSWEQNQEKVATVDTIEDFWQVFNYIEPASNLGQGCDYMVFKKGIQPDWEDFQNMSGGRWIHSSEKSNRGDVLDCRWLEIIFILIGEHAGDYADMVNGAVINIRTKRDKLAVWLKDANNMIGVMEIGRLVKHRLGLRDGINFTIHREADKGSNRLRFGSQNSPSKIYI